MTMFTLVDIRTDNPKEGRSQYVTDLPEQKTHSLLLFTTEIWAGRPFSGVCKQGQHQGFLSINLAQGSRAAVRICISVISLELTAHYDLSF